LDKAPEAFRTISEVADELEVPKHVLRFWEAKFAQLKPMKRGGGRRYYRPEDVALLRGIRFLLYNDGYTIRGVQKILREHGPRFVMEFRRMADDEDRDDGMSAHHEIPDIAAEAAQGGGAGASIAREPPERRMPKPDPAALGALLDEIETCRRILVAAKE
jgi:DNA-binding transcriptional MerR regulator